MVKGFDINFIFSLYNKYLNDLKRARECQKKLYSEKGYSRFEKNFVYRVARYIMKKSGFYAQKKIIMQPQLDDVEAEITYLLIREFKPKTIVEISPCGGWSTSWILQAIKDNKLGKLYSYDLVDDSTKTIPPDLSKDKWFFIKGDIKENINKLPKKIDYLFMDSNHSADFAQWYIQKLFPKLKSGIPISVHDVFHTADPSSSDSEASVIVDWLKQKRIGYFTASPIKAKTVYDEIMVLKNKLDIAKSIHFSQNNPMLFFIFKE